MTAILIFGSEEIVRLLFQRGAFTATETRTVALVQSAYLLQLPVHLLGILYVRLISALQANRLLTIGSAVNLTVNLVLNVVFMRRWGAAGIALSTAGVYAVSCVYLAIASHRRLANAEANAASLTLVSTSHLRTTTVPPVATTPDSEASCASAA